MQDVIEQLQEVIEQCRAAWPPLFLGTAINGLSGDALNWSTLQNKRSKGQIPDACFLRSGPRVLVVRDKFLDWWGSTLQPARATKASHTPPQPRAGQRRRAAVSASAAQHDDPGAPERRPEALNDKRRSP
jgi:hypothetical protein